ncbi:MAG: hypothetical protein M1816_007156 [Peltula sp. TS41687]|nr:MAG: hypothetical protein M1816_007156 [Peltula sp. TS41687]
MPKKGSQGRGGASKKASPFTPTDDNVIFTNDDSKKTSAKPDPKPSKGKNVSSNPSSVSSKTGNGDTSGLPDTVSKRPDTKTLIGGASWTGKLPVTLLSEHCQKQRWEKPEYTMTKTAHGFISSVILKAINPKTSEMTTLPQLRLPASHKDLAAQATAVEARHFAATYALFRVCSMRNVHMALPPTYRDLWKGVFQELKENDIKQGHGWMYDADPFRVQKEREEIQTASASHTGAKENDKGNHPMRPVGQNGPLGMQLPLIEPRRTHVNTGSERRQVPKVDMGKRTRVQVEAIIRKHAVWNRHDVKLSAKQKAAIVERLSNTGFRKSHIEEAATYCKDEEETLEWLLIHVPEDDLPSWSLPEGYTAGVSMASGDIKREAIIKRLAAVGYAIDLCEEILDTTKGNEARAAAVLQDILVTGSRTSFSESALPNGSVTNSSESQGVWEEEQTALEAIYGDRCIFLSPDQYQIKLDTCNLPNSITVQFRKPAYGRYPETVPIVSLNAEPPLPAYIRLAIIKKAVGYAESNLQGEQMIFAMIDWLEAESAGIIINPGRLLDVAPAASAVAAYNQKLETAYKRTRFNMPKALTKHAIDIDSRRLLDEWKAKQASPKQQTMLANRQLLPAWGMREFLVDEVNKHTVTIVSGETGSGKSTQSVQFILDDMIQRNVGALANIICTQPRRISALSLADRVSEERCDIVGREVGYAIRGESRQTTGVTKIKFMTTGVLLRQLQTSGGTEDDMITALTSATHIFVDEVHERSLDADFLLALLRQVLQKRKDLKVILMSATLDAEVFAEYFRETGDIGRVEIEGRTYSVQDHYLGDILRMTDYSSGYYRTPEEDVEVGGGDLSLKDHTNIDYELIARTVEAIDSDMGTQDGGILIFLPGSVEIDRTLEAVRTIRNVHGLALHASLSPNEQKKVFLPPPKGRRKVIAATNVAETSITIEDIVAVIDTGRVKETAYDPQTNMVKLAEVWASRAACKQRRGRAGRVRAGKCYKLFGRNVEMAKMVERPEPEIRRVPLEQLCLSVKAMGITDVHSFLGNTITPPEKLAVEGAMKMLQRMGALDGDQLTALGQHLARIPADLRCGKLLVYGATFGCLEACLTIASILTTKSPFVSPMDKRNEAKAVRSSFGKGEGDLLADLRAFEEWCAMRGSRSHHPDIRTWCDHNFLSLRTLNDILSNRTQYLASLKESGFVPNNYSDITPSSSSSSSPPTYNRHNNSPALLRALIAGSFSPQIARIEFPDKKFAASMSGAVELDPEARTIKYFTQHNGRVFVHPSSTLFDAQTFPGGAAYMSFFTKLETSKIFVRDLTPFNVYTAMLFSGPVQLDLGFNYNRTNQNHQQRQHQHRRDHVILVDGWLRLRGWARIAVLVSRLRTLLDEVLARKLDDPLFDLDGENEVVAIVRRLVELDGLDC